MHIIWEQKYIPGVIKQYLFRNYLLLGDKNSGVRNVEQGWLLIIKPSPALLNS